MYCSGLPRVCLALVALVVAQASLPAAAAARRGPVPKLFAFYSRLGGAELERLEEVGSRVSVLAPNWYGLNMRTGEISSGGAPAPSVMALSGKLGFAVWPVVNARVSGSKLIHGEAGREKVVTSVAALASGYGLVGVTLDIEEMAPEDGAPYTALVQRLAAVLHAQGRKLAVYVLRRTRAEVRRSALAYDWRALSRAADVVLASGYNEHGATTTPGPVTTRRGFRRLSEYAASISRRRIAPTIGAFGYRWPAAGGRAQLVASFDAELRWTAATRIGSFDGRRTVAGSDQVFFESAEDMWARERTVRSVRGRWIGLFSLGREPARFWAGSKVGR